MLTALIALLSPAHAAEVQVATMVPINILVDGVPMVWDENTGLGVSGNLPAGRHVIEARNMMGKTMAYKEMDLALDDQIRFEYRKKELWHIGTYKLAMAAPVAPTTVVVETQPAVPVMVPGVGITVSDGNETVSVGAGVYGGGVVVSDGQNTVAVNAGVQMSGTSTTTVVTTPGYVPAAPVAVAPPAPVGMDAGSFNSLLRQMDDASFSDDKLSLLSTAVANNWLSCAQLAQLLDTFSFGSDKVKAVGIARNSVVDPQNAHVLNDKFSFSSDAQKAQAFFR